MKAIKKLIERMEEELEDSKCYAEEYLMRKAEGDTMASRYREMANDEMKHAGVVHEDIVEKVKTLRAVYTPPQEMLDTWEHEHKEYIERVTWIKTMLAM